MAMNSYGAPAPGRNASMNASNPKRGQRTATSAAKKLPVKGLIASAMQPAAVVKATPKTFKKG